MNEELRILILEDCANDAELIGRELRKGGLTFLLERVETQRAFMDALEHDRPDLILSDHGLPVFNGFEALAAAKSKCPEVPFIFVTGLAGAEKEIETFEKGALDYVLKDRLSRLVPVVRRALKDAEQRAAHRVREQALRETEERFHALVEAVEDYAICMLDREGRVKSWNSGAQWIHGYESSEIVGQHFSCLFAPEVAGDLPPRALAHAIAQGRFHEEMVLLRKGASCFWAEVVITALREQQIVQGFALVTRDVTERKQIEADRERLIHELQSAINDVKILSGTLPICPSCKKVRDFQGQWHPLEDYLQAHSEAILTNEICRECSAVK